MRIFFAGDCHFEPKPDPERLSRFLMFLNEIDEGDTLVLLGDIFDFWFEYPDMIQAGHFPILCAFKELSERAEIFYIPGNHDIWAGRLLESFGPKVRKGGVMFDLGGNRLIAVHGDMIGRRNSLGRLILGNPFLTWMYSLIHPALGVPLASWVSKLSRVKSGRLELPPEVTAWMLKEMTEDIRCLVAGHFHTPFLRKVNDKVLACAGDWLSAFTYIVLEGEFLSLVGFGKEKIEEVKI
ncbi:MAG: UDP-2,3-diacylglucosamine diphosphatase [candidate division WOR-3 bacterium]